MRRLLMVLLLLFLFVILPCQAAQIIRIGFNTWVGYEAIVIAEQKKFFENMGVQVELQQFNSLSDVMQAFDEGKIDVMFSTSNEVLLLAEKGKRLQITLVTDYSNGADTIVAHKPIRTMQDLQGKRIGVEMGSISHFVLLRALQKAEMSRQDVTIVDVNESDMLQEFSNENVDAIATWAPYTQQAVKDNGRVIFSSGEIPGQIVDVMSIRQDLINQDPLSCYKIVVAYLKAVDWLQHNKKEGLEIMAKAANMTPEEFADSLKGVHLMQLPENLAAFGLPREKGTLYPITQQFMLFLYDENVLHRTLNTDSLLDPEFIWHVAKK